MSLTTNELFLEEVDSGRQHKQTPLDWRMCSCLDLHFQRQSLLSLVAAHDQFEPGVIVVLQLGKKKRRHWYI